MKPDLYPTRPLKMWDRMLELRHKNDWLTYENAHERPLVVFCVYPLCPVLAGIGSWGYRGVGGPFFVEAARNIDSLNRYHEAVDARGFPRGEACSYMRFNLAQLILGLMTRHPTTNEHTPVDVVFELAFCTSPAKTAQLAAEMLGVPHFLLDMPQEGGEATVRYLSSRIHEGIEFLAKTSGREYNDEWLIEGVQNQWDCGALWARVCYANRAVPAPLTYPTLHELRYPGYVAGHKRESVVYFEELLAEVDDRVKDGISAIGLETARFAYEGEKIVYASDLVPDLVQRRGAVSVTGWDASCTGTWQIGPESRLTPAPRFRELGLTLKSRDDAVEFLARAYVEHSIFFRSQRIPDKAQEVLHRVEDWGCQGAIFHLDTGCRSQMCGIMEAKLLLQSKGFATVSFQGSSNDPTLLTPGQVSDRLDAFFESLGLPMVEGDFAILPTTALPSH